MNQAAKPVFAYDIPLGDVRFDDERGWLYFGSLKVEKQVEPAAAPVLSLEDVSFVAGPEPLVYGPVTVSSSRFFFTGALWFRVWIEGSGAQLNVAMYADDSFTVPSGANPFQPNTTAATPILTYQVLAQDNPTDGPSLTVSHVLGATGPPWREDVFTWGWTDENSFSTWRIENGARGWHQYHQVETLVPAQNAAKRFVITAERVEFTIDPQTDTEVQTGAYRENYAVFAYDKAQDTSAQPWSAGWDLEVVALLSTESEAGGQITRTEYEYRMTEPPDEMYTPIPDLAADLHEAARTYQGGVDSQLTLVGYERDGVESLGSGGEAPLRISPWLDASGEPGGPALESYSFADYDNPGTTGLVASQAERLRLAVGGPVPLTSTDWEQFDVIDSEPNVREVRRYGAFTGPVLGRDGVRLQIEDILWIPPDFDGSTIMASEPLPAVNFVRGPTFRRADQSGNVTVFEPETGTGFDAEALELPLADAPFKMSATIQHAQAGGTLYSHLGGSSLVLAASGGSEDANYVPGKTTRSVSYRGKHGSVLEREQVWTDSEDWATLGERRTFYTEEGKIEQVKQDGVVTQSYAYPDDHTEVATDAEGGVTTRVSDAEGRLLSETRSGAPVLPALGAEAQADQVTTYSETTETVGGQRREVSTMTTSAGGLAQSHTTRHAAGGAWSSSTDAAGATTTRVSSGLQEQTTAPGGVTSIRQRYLDGRPKAVSGTGVVPRNHSFQIVHEGANQGLVETISTTVGEGARATVRRSTWDGELLEQTEGGVTTTFSYDAAGRLTSRAVPGLKAYRFEYDYRGRVVREGYDMDDNGQLTAGGVDIIVERDEHYAPDGGAWWRVTTESRYVNDNDGSTKLTTVTREKQGQGPNLHIEVSEITDDGTTPVTLVTTVFTRVVNRAERIVTETSTTTRHPGRTATRHYYNGLLVAGKELESDIATLYRYDALGRRTAVLDSRPGVSQSIAYDPATGWVAATANAAGETTSYGYYGPAEANAGRLKWSRNPAGEVVFHAYNPRGQLTHQWGSGTYPVKYGYNGFGDRVTLTTYRTTSGGAGGSPADSPSLPALFNNTADASVTTWNIAPATGRLLGKIDAASKAVTYSYNAAGQMATRAWAREVVTSYCYDPAGRLTGIGYSDATPSVGIAYDRAGRVVTRTDAAGEHSFAHDPQVGVRESETVSGGLWDGLSLSRLVDGTGRAAGDAWQLGTNPAQQTTHTYDSQSRLSSISLGPVSAVYQYEGGGTTVRGVSRPMAAMGSLTASIEGRFSRDAAGRLRTAHWSRASAWGGVHIYGSVTYQHDAAGRRIRATDERNLSWVYGYNSRGELIDAEKQAASGAALPGWSHGYAYDDIGNRVQTQTPEGETLGREPNALNQAAQRQTEQERWLRGRANPQATVTVNGQSVQRDGAAWRFKQEAGVQDTLLRSRYYQVDAGAQNELKHTPFLPASVTAVYDDDGNLTFDGRWHYEWDGENRLITMQSAPMRIVSVHGSMSGYQQVTRLEFAYDGLGRRIYKKVSTAPGNAQGSGYTWTVQDQWLYVWQDWRMLAECWWYESANPAVFGPSRWHLRRGYLWGMDLVSGVYQGGMAEFGAALNPAGGVGGLLWALDYDKYVPQNGTYRQLAPWYDGNGNILGWVENNAVQIKELRRQEYDPFGRLITIDPVRSPYPLAAGGPDPYYDEYPPFGFSTKFEDVETGLWYFNHRYLHPELQWPSRDPIGEQGGINLYGMVGNDPVNKVDVLGLKVYSSGCCGANINDWVVPELHSLMSGWNAFARQWPKTVSYSVGIGHGGTLIIPRPTLSDFRKWIYANTDYKNPAKFTFSKGTACGTGDCGRSVTLCGKCVKSSVLGNIMYGLMGQYAGFSDSDLESIQNVKYWGSFIGAVYDPNDSNAYDIGQGIEPDMTSLGTELTLQDVCRALNEQPGFSSGSGLEVTEDGNQNRSNEKCKLCTQKTRETRHGGNEQPGVNANALNPEKR